MCGLQFRLSPHSFFQTNTAQAERLYGVVVQAVAEALDTSSSSSSGSGAGGSQCTASGAEVDSSSSSSESGLVLDFFCGTGTIALCLAAALPGRRVVGCDVSPSNIADARANADLNGLANVSFVRGDLNQLQSAGTFGGSSSSSSKQGTKKREVQELEALNPQVVVVDPARAGLGAAVVRYLVGCGARRVVYVSCNAATQARDLEQLCAGGFRLASWTAVDLFPQTDVAHVETVAVLDRV
jgi:tRNA/tmRNA/rRNA uracil-C5-methylase (TrmA/RlmC/RlmD family)